MISIIIIGFITLFTLYIADTICQSKNSRCFSKTARLSWKTLKKIYGINPNRWRYEKVIEKVIDNGYTIIKRWNKVILYNTKNNEEDMWENNTCRLWYITGYKYSNYIVRIKLSFFGWLAFHFNRIFNKRKDIEGTEMVLDSVSKDINKIRQQSQEQIAEANRMMQEVIERINNDEIILS